MRFRLLHYTSFVPILSCAMVDPWGLKCSWLFYLFFTYLVLERNDWNGYPLSTWVQLQRSSETCMVFSLAIAHWFSPWLSPLAWLTLKLPRTVSAELVYVICCFALYSNDFLQMSFVFGMVVSEYSRAPTNWRGAVHHRILTRCVQVSGLLLAYRSSSHRLVLVVFVCLLKALCFLLPPDNVSNSRWWNGVLPVVFELSIKDHTL